MIYEPLRIQPKGRAIKIPQKTGSRTQERGESQIGKTPKVKGRICICQSCGIEFRTVKSLKETPKNCSMKCFRDLQPKWHDCSKCHALIGLGCKKSARTLGLSPASVAVFWQKEGIKSQCPERSWNVWARRNKKGSFSGLPEWWEDKNLRNAWKIETNPKFPDWSILWNNEVSRRTSNRRYQSMSQEEKSQWNKKAYQNRDNQRQIEYTRQWKRERYKDPEYRNAELEKQLGYYIARIGGIEEYERRKVARMILANSGRKVDRWRSAFSKLMRTVKKGGSDTYSPTLGCTTRQFRGYLESQFRPWMTWENYGKRWQVDHIIPCAAFDHGIASQAKQCWHYLNLRPMCAKKNHRKSATITEPQLSLLIEYV